MEITVDPELAVALNEAAKQQRVAAEVVAVNALRERFLASSLPIQPRDEWERQLLGLAKDCGISLSDAALSREELYE